MTIQQIRKTARKQRAAFHKGLSNLQNLYVLIKSQGFSIVQFQQDNDPDVDIIISKLDLYEYTSRLKGFTYSDQTVKIVFVRADLTDEEKAIVLAHEEGHIICGHLNAYNVSSNDVAEEMEANVFTYYLLTPPILERLGDALRINRVAIISLVVLVGALSCAINLGIQQKTYYGEYYITEHGERYHQKECIIIKDRTNVHRMTVDEFDSGDYSPCQICLP